MERLHEADRAAGARASFVILDLEEFEARGWKTADRSPLPI
jgi:hypothetical protein